MRELEGIYKLTEQCRIDFSMQVALCDGAPKKLSRRGSIALQVLIDAALHKRVATYEVFGDALWPETGWDNARRQALKDTIHHLRGIVGNIIQARSSIGYSLTVMPVAQDDLASGYTSTTGFDTSPYVESLEKIDSSVSRASSILDDYKNLSKELLASPDVNRTLQAHQERLQQYQSNPDAVIEGASCDQYNVTTGADINRFKQEAAQLDYVTGEISNALSALKSASSRIKQELQRLDDLSRSQDASESNQAKKGMFLYMMGSQVLDNAYAQAADSIQRDIESCEQILSSLKFSLSSVQLVLPNALNYRPQPFHSIHSVLDSSNRHLTAIHKNIRFLSGLYESELSLLEMTHAGEAQQ